jgi:Glycogen recognition site of AMP-activated protein kinase
MVIDHESDPFIEEIARELRRPVHLDPLLDERVMAALEPGVISLAARRMPAPWYRRPLSFSVSPLVAMAAAAALVGIAAFGALRYRPTTGSQVAIAPSVELTPVANVRGGDAALSVQQFIFVAPEARSVRLVGDFNDWDTDRTPMVRASANGAWSVTVPLTPGRHEYQFVVDDTLRLTDPSAPQTSSDFGSPNSVITVARRVP